MICSVCNKEVNDGVKICPFCGADLTLKENKVIEVCFEKPAPPPVIEVLFAQPVIAEPEYVEEPIYEKAPVYEEPKAPVTRVRKIKKKAPTKVNKKNAPVKEKKKTKDKANFFLVILSLLWAPYPGILLWILTSKKTPKASQVYGNCAIIMFVLKCMWQYIKSIVTTILAVVLTATLIIGGTAVLFMIQYGITFA